MCKANVQPEAEQALADVLRDICVALDPEHPERVVIGPVDFGTATCSDFGGPAEGGD